MAWKGPVLICILFLMTNCTVIRMERQVTRPLDTFPMCISYPMKQAAITYYWGLIEAGESNDEAVRHTHQMVGRILLNTPEYYWKQFEGIDFQDWERRHGRRPRPTPGFNSRRLHIN